LLQVQVGIRQRAISSQISAASSCRCQDSANFSCI
jgi:hypothetical protein